MCWPLSATTSPNNLLHKRLWTISCQCSKIVRCIISLCLEEVVSRRFMRLFTSLSTTLWNMFGYWQQDFEDFGWFCSDSTRSDGSIWQQYCRAHTYLSVDGSGYYGLFKLEVIHRVRFGVKYLNASLNWHHRHHRILFASVLMFLILSDIKYDEPHRMVLARASNLKFGYAERTGLVPTCWCQGLCCKLYFFWMKTIK